MTVILTEFTGFVGKLQIACGGLGGYVIIRETGGEKYDEYNGYAARVCRDPAVFAG